MKSLKILAAGTVALMAVTCACTSEKKNDTNVVSLAEAEQTFASSLTSNDTTAMLEAGQTVMDSLKAGNVEAALDMLYARSENGMRPLEEAEKQQLRARFERFPVVSWKLDHYDMSIPSLNDLKYTYSFSSEPGKPGLALMFNPVKTDEGWKLMLKQADQAAKDADNALDPQTVVRMPDEQ